jgi:hypothetical protein
MNKIESYCKKLESRKVDEIKTFIKSNENTKPANIIESMKLIKDNMKIVANTVLKNSEKKDFVMTVIDHLSGGNNNNNNNNNISFDFNIGEAIEFIYETSKDKFGSPVHKVGLKTKCFDCISYFTKKQQ